ncbi:MAG: RtcB family protein [Elusimicrobia bacterium]|nr:RtcB family protein [Elusimicrobiota bacterium]
MLEIKSWCKDIEASAQKQIDNLARLPFAFKHIAVMPDCHTGYGMPIGGVLACEGVIIPNAVGVDIGCGVTACQTSLTELEAHTLKKIIGEIRSSIPMGFNLHKVAKDIAQIPKNHSGKVVAQHYQNARCQMGTLGGGNHFIEIQKGSDGKIWFMIHSGSRNLGKQVADYYNTQAKKYNKQTGTELPAGFDLAYIPESSPLFKEYLDEMNYCLEFARQNRLEMARVVSSIISGLADGKANRSYDIHHNYAARENHFGHNVWLHRKGATSARLGEVGIIPGSQGTKSYIVSGLGNPESFNSCSHGAGRLMSRTKAMQELSVAKEAERLNKLNILHSIRGVKDLDEAPSAYKNITEVMSSQTDLVKIKVELSPMAVLKG